MFRTIGFSILLQIIVLFNFSLHVDAAYCDATHGYGSSFKCFDCVVDPECAACQGTICVRRVGSGCLQTVVTDVSGCSGYEGPQDCQVSNWTAWSACQSNCSAGNIKYRTRFVIVPRGGVPVAGSSCPDLEEESPDCLYSEFTWTPFTPCVLPCGPENQTRTRVVLEPAGSLGVCDPPSETQDCANVECGTPTPTPTPTPSPNFEDTSTSTPTSFETPTPTISAKETTADLGKDDEANDTTAPLFGIFKFSCLIVLLTSLLGF